MRKFYGIFDSSNKLVGLTNLAWMVHDRASTLCRLTMPAIFEDMSVAIVVRDQLNSNHMHLHHIEEISCQSSTAKT